MKKTFTKKMKHLLYCSMALPFATLPIDTNAQVSLTATAGTQVGTYSTLSNAFSAINAGTHQGVINISITDNITEPAAPVALLKSDGVTSIYTRIVIMPSGGNRTIQSASPAPGFRAVIELQGADGVVIDGDDPATAGSRNLSIIVDNTTSVAFTAGVLFASNSATGTDGATNDTIRNCIITGGRSASNSTTVNYGFLMDNYSTSSTTTGSYNNTNICVENNLITRAWYGINANGTSSTTNNTGLLIKNNIIGDATNSANSIGAYGIVFNKGALTAGNGSAIIEGNDITVGNSDFGYASTLYGIQVGSNSPGTIIRKNYIHDLTNLTSSSFGVYGIHFSSANDGLIIVNNMIRDCKKTPTTTSYISTASPAGVFFNAASTNIQFNHNTIVMNSQLGGNTTYTSFCIHTFGMATTGTFSQFLNNVLVNNDVSTGACDFNVFSINNLPSTSLVNNNVYFAPSGSVGNINSSSGLQATLSNWQTATAKDDQSYSFAPAFISSTDLHIDNTVPTSLESGGAVTNVTEDFDGETRGATPDIGADEFNGTSTPLAIKLGDFSVSKRTNSNVLAWNTYSENANDYFIIEKSHDALSFEVIGQVPANSSDIKNYSFTDNKPYMGYNYYRLKMIDDNSKKGIYSKVVSVNIGNSNFHLSAYPNPANNYINLLVSEIIGDGLVEITDASGRICHSQKISHLSESISLSGLCVGSYILRYKDNNNTKSMMFNKR